MTASSDRLAHHVPQYHVRLPRGYLNDPNGPVEVAGTTHLYFQSRPSTDLSVPVEWGHATSPDLVRWTLHRPALVPVPGGDDSDGCWSGNAVVRGGQIHAYYSGKTVDSPFQPVLRAVSTDGGASFGRPLRVVGEPGDGVTMFRDPFVSRETAGFSMVVGAAREGGAAALFRYASGDGENWEPAGELASLSRREVDGVDSGEGWECPQLLPTASGEWALVSSWSFEGGIGEVLAFPLDRAPAARRFDHGTNFYASSVMRESSRGPVVWGWVTEGRTREWWTEAGWAGALSLPRVVVPGRDGRLDSAPQPDVDSLRTGAARPAAGAEIGAQAELIVDVARTGVIRLAFSADEWCDIVVDREAGTVAIDRSRASADPRAHGGVAIAPDTFDDAAGRPDLRIFLDGSVLELFTSAGRSLTSRVYPITPPPWRVDAADGTVLDLAASISLAGR